MRPLHASISIDSIGLQVTAVDLHNIHIARVRVVRVSGGGEYTCTQPLREWSAVVTGGRWSARSGRWPEAGHCCSHQGALNIAQGQ